MSDLPVPTASRLRRPGWRDARLLVGLLLVLVSVALGSYVVAHADDRVPVFAAAGPLVPGQPLGEDDLVRVDVQLGSQAARYLSATRGLPPERYVLREVADGELVPAAAVGGKDLVGVPVDPGAPAGGAGFTGPELALEGVSVSGLPKASSGLGSGSGSSRPIQVMAPTDRIKEIIGAVDLGARVTVVPVAGTGVGGAS